MIAHKQEDGSVAITLHIVKPDLSGYNPEPVENPIPRHERTAALLPVICGGDQFPRLYRHPRTRKLIDVRDDTLQHLYEICEADPKTFSPKSFIEEVADISVNRPALISEVLNNLKNKKA
jgi:hypothetical protein